jgi:putative oxidoreductase
LFNAGFLTFYIVLSKLNRILENSRLEFGAFLLAHYVAIAHFLGGIFIAIGLNTHVAIIFHLFFEYDY